MRTSRVLLSLVPATAGLVLAAAAAGAPPGASYPWAQPGTAPQPSSLTQPPAWIPITSAARLPAVAGSSYEWAQPGTAPVSSTYTQPPASVPIVPGHAGP